MSNDIPGTLTIAAVPIGCLDDASPRLAAALGQAQIIAAEDTRRLLRLASRLGVPLTGRIVSYIETPIMSVEPSYVPPGIAPSPVPNGLSSRHALVGS